MIRCTSEQSTLYTYKNKIRTFNPLTMESDEFFDASGFLERNSTVSCFDADKEFVAVAGTDGELIVVTGDSLVQYSQRVSNQSITCVRLARGGKYCIFADSSSSIGKVELGSEAVATTIPVEGFGVQNCHLHPSSDSAVIFSHGTHRMQLNDLRAGQKSVWKSTHMKNALLASDWHCSGDVLAVSQADFVTCLWDLRMLCVPFHSLHASLCEQLNCTFSSCGSFLAVGESDDFVNIFPVHNVDAESQQGSLNYQSIDFIGEMAGLAFSPNANSLFIGIGGDIAYSGLVEFERKNAVEQMLEHFI